MFINNLSDYIRIKRSGLFDSEYYLQKYPDVKKANINPLWHYVKYGWKEGRDLSATCNDNSLTFKIR